MPSVSRRRLIPAQTPHGRDLTPRGYARRSCGYVGAAEDEFAPGVDAELGVDVLEVSLDRAGGHLEAAGDRVGAQALGRQLEHAALARGQLVGYVTMPASAAAARGQFPVCLPGQPVRADRLGGG